MMEVPLSAWVHVLGDFPGLCENLCQGSKTKCRYVFIMESVIICNLIPRKTQILTNPLTKIYNGCRDSGNFIDARSMKPSS